MTVAPGARPACFKLQYCPWFEGATSQGAKAFSRPLTAACVLSSSTVPTDHPSQLPGNSPAFPRRCPASFPSKVNVLYHFVCFLPSEPNVPIQLVALTLQRGYKFIMSNAVEIIRPGRTHMWLITQETEHENTIP